MDMQGQPTGGAADGTKARSGQDPVQESTGAIASDSLAAESSREGGAFAANPNSAPSGVPGAKSTLANTDTSAATELDAAPDAAAREERAAWDEPAGLKGAGGLKYAEGLGGQPDLGGVTSESGFSGGPSARRAETGTGSGGGLGDSGALRYRGGDAASSSAAWGGLGDSRKSGYEGGDTPSGGAAQGGSGADVDAAPSYVQSVLQGGDGKPKGRNLHEGGFEGEAPSDFDVESKDDPGRVALRKAEGENEAPLGGTGAPQRGFDNKTKYDELDDSKPA